MSRHKRKQEFVDPLVQGALTRRLVFHWLAFVATAAILSCILVWMEHPMLSWRDVAGEAWEKNSAILLLLVCMIPVFVFDSIKLSNRFTGPIFRLRQVLKSLADGNPPEKVEFRGADFWQDLAKDFTQVMARLEKAEGHKD